MRGWMSIAYLAKPKNLNGGLVARGASGLPFVLHPGLTLAVVPPQLDAPRTLTVSEVTERAENEALVFFDEVSDLSSAELLAGCELLAREEDIDASVLVEAEALPAWEGWSVHDERAGYVGEVVEVAERATQPLLTVRRAEGGEALIPLVNEFIVEVDEDGRRIDAAQHGRKRSAQKKHANAKRGTNGTVQAKHENPHAPKGKGGQGKSGKGGSKQGGGRGKQGKRRG